MNRKKPETLLKFFSVFQVPVMHTLLGFLYLLVYLSLKIGSSLRRFTHISLITLRFSFFTECAMKQKMSSTVVVFWGLRPDHRFHLIATKIWTQHLFFISSWYYFEFSNLEFISGPKSVFGPKQLKPKIIVTICKMVVVKANIKELCLNILDGLLKKSRFYG